MRPLVTFLVPDIGSPVIGAALKLADLLLPDYATEIVGPDFGRGVCSLYRDAYPFRALPAGRLYRWPDFAWERRRLGRALAGDVIVAVKAFADTVPVALTERARRGVPVAVYLDEWDGAVWQQKTRRERWRSWLLHAHHPLEEPYTGWVESKIKDADAVWSTTTFLQRRFGGEIQHAGVDGQFFQPQPADRVAALKAALGLAGCRVIVFGGVVRPHKGVEEILEALAEIGDAGNRLLVVGPITEHLSALQADPRYRDYVTVAGAGLHDGSARNAEIHQQMPLYLDVGDLVVLPLRDTLLAQSQMPIKVFEAMAMGKPLVVTRVADLPATTEGCGWVVEPGDGRALAETVAKALASEEERKAYGRRARERAVAEFSREVCALRIKTEVGRLLKSGTSR